MLVNNAALYGGLKGARFEKLDEAQWDAVMNVNVKGVWQCCKSVVGAMRDGGGGSIINIASLAAVYGLPYGLDYVASKAAVIALTKSLGKELAGHDIAVNCVTPATARTRIHEQVSPEFVEYMRAKIPRGRFVTVEEIAEMVAWLASAENSFTTGAVFDLSGGRATY